MFSVYQVMVYWCLKSLVLTQHWNLQIMNSLLIRKVVIKILIRQKISPTISSVFVLAMEVYHIVTLK